MACPDGFTERLFALPLAGCWEAGEWGFAATTLVPVAVAAVPYLRRTAVSGGRAAWRRCFAHKPPPPVDPGAFPRRGVQGREQDLDALRWKLDHPIEPGRPAAVVLHGPGGVGKTTLAAEHLKRHAAAGHPAARISAPNAEAELAARARRLDPTLPGDLPAPELARLALERILDDPRRWLLVFDNAESAAQIDRWLPERGELHVLVTARDSGWPATHYREQAVGLLPEPEAAALLMAEADPPESRPAGPAEGRDAPAAHALARDLGRLPLALVMAGAWLRDTPSTPFADYAKRLDDILHGPTPDDYRATQADGVDPTLAAAVGLSLDRCGDDERALLNLFAHLAPEGLTADLLDPVGALPEEHTRRSDVPEPLAALVEDGARRERALAALVRRSLLTEDAGEGHALHRLTAAVIRRRLAPARDAAEAAAAVLAAGYPYDSDVYTEWPACARLTPHVLALHTLPEGERPATQATHFLFNQTSVYLRNQGDLPAARALAETSLALKRADYGPDHRETGAGHTQLGLILADLGDLDGAEPHLRRALEISAAPGAAMEDVRAIGPNNLAVLLEDRAAEARAAGEAATARVRCAEAQALFREALALDRAAARRAEAAGDAPGLAAARIDKATRLNNLATLNAAAGRPRRARTLAAAAVAVWERAGLPPDDPRHANHRNTLGARLLTLGDPAAARPHLARALAIREDKLPPGHPHVRTTARWLAACLFALDPPETEGAEALCDCHGLDPVEIRADAARIMADAPRRRS